MTVARPVAVADLVAEAVLVDVGLPTVLEGVGVLEGGAVVAVAEMVGLAGGLPPDRLMAARETMPAP
jgi:hypothetical protein